MLEESKMNLFQKVYSCVAALALLVLFGDLFIWRAVG